MEGATLPQTLPTELKTYERVWEKRDRDNVQLKKLLPVDFVRSTVTKHVNHDLILAAAAGVGIVADRLHQSVVSARVGDDPAWRFRGFALPILLPRVDDLSWAQIAELRRDRSMQRFRLLLNELEHEALNEAASGGDVERLLHQLYAGKLVEAQAAAVSKLGQARELAGGFIVGVAADVATAGLIAPFGTVAGAAVGTAVSAVQSVRRRNATKWMSVDARLREMTAGR